ncbi:MAG: hypothetical protein HOE62_09490 [Alphaproteobacteria bacterium]|nr:hypothetical protein [Alphaproteobacteria bacterium]MBT4018170.1 hypothetical protein [Alphaproteobacteria bacterium]MBT4965103.1 hypothetical protein [Alphaproteobacteria bacterium]MBT5917022.1 hypothetical protein [Alphaproteobacteria bacterium]MBT6385293.1 hypothetical protein [Alphaproteobacteria bacterium]
MIIGNIFSKSMLYTPATPIKPGAAADLSGALETAETADKAHEVAAKYDLRNISPREIDLMAKELRLHQMISDSDMFELLTYGADYLSNSPNNTWSEEQLNRPVDLIDQLVQQIADEKSANDPVEAHKNVLEFIQKLEARSYLPVSGIIA